MLLFFSVLLIMLGVYISYTLNGKKKRCTEMVSARIAFVNRINTGEGNNSVLPFYSYSYNGQDYVERTGNFIPVVPHSEGETVYIYINPSDPREIYDEGAQKYSRRGIIMMLVVGALTGIIAVVKLFSSISVDI